MRLFKIALMFISIGLVIALFYYGVLLDLPAYVDKELNESLFDPAYLAQFSDGASSATNVDEASEAELEILAERFAEVGLFDLRHVTHIVSYRILKETSSERFSDDMRQWAAFQDLKTRAIIGLNQWRIEEVRQYWLSVRKPAAHVQREQLNDAQQAAIDKALDKHGSKFIQVLIPLHNNLKIHHAHAEFENIVDYVSRQAPVAEEEVDKVFEDGEREGSSLAYAEIFLNGQCWVDIDTTNYPFVRFETKECDRFPVLGEEIKVLEMTSGTELAPFKSEADIRTGFQQMASELQSLANQNDRFPSREQARWWLEQFEARSGLIPNYDTTNGLVSASSDTLSLEHALSLEPEKTR